MIERVIHSLTRLEGVLDARVVNMHEVNELSTQTAICAEDLVKSSTDSEWVDGWIETKEKKISMRRIHGGRTLWIESTTALATGRILPHLQRSAALIEEII